MHRLGTESAAYNVVAKVLYRAASPSVPATCLSICRPFVRPFYQALDRALSARCSAINVDMNVTFVKSQTEMQLVEDNIAEITYVLSVTPATRSASRNSTICADRRWAWSLTCPSRPPVPFCRLCWTWPPLPTANARR